MSGAEEETGADWMVFCCTPVDYTCQAGVCSAAEADMGSRHLTPSLQHEMYAGAVMPGGTSSLQMTAHVGHPCDDEHPPQRHPAAGRIL